MLQTNRILGLLRMDLLMVIFIPLCYLIFPKIFPAPNGKKSTWSIIALISVFVGVNLFLTTPSALSLINLSDKYAMVTGEDQRNQLLVADKAILASNTWHGTGAILGGFFTSSLGSPLP